MLEYMHLHGGEIDAEVKKYLEYLNMTMNNNYRKLHGKHTRRWVHLRKLEYKRARERFVKEKGEI